MVVAGALGGGVAVACGDRTNVDSSNDSESRGTPQATPATTNTNPTQLTPTGETQPEITQPPSESPVVPGEGTETGSAGG